MYWQHAGFKVSSATTLVLIQNEPLGTNESFLPLCLYIFFLQQCYPSGISPMGNSGCFPRGKLAATESCYPTYGAYWVF